MNCDVPKLHLRPAWECIPLSTWVIYGLSTTDLIRGMHIQVDPQYLVLSWVPSELASQLRLRPVLLDEIERFGCQVGPST